MKQEPKNLVIKEWETKAGVYNKDKAREFNERFINNITKRNEDSNIIKRQSGDTELLHDRKISIKEQGGCEIDQTIS